MSAARLRASGLLAAMLAVGCGGAEPTPEPADRVPQLRGLTPGQARAELAAVNASPAFTTNLADACAGLPPSGRIAAQKPAAGEPLRAGPVRLQVGCGSPSRPCSSQELRLKADGVTGVLPGGGHSVYFKLMHDRGGPCVLDDTMRLIVEDTDGSEVAIAGNPVALRLDHELGVGQGLQYILGWYGCPESGSGLVTISAEIAGVRDASTMARPPCLGARPSSLKPATREVETYNDSAVYATALERERPAWAPREPRD